WVLYFCSPRALWPRALGVTIAGAVASLPLAPILLRYRQAHEALGLHRTLNEIQYFSARSHSWLEIWPDVWLWSRIFPPGKDNLFPGLVVVLLAAAGIIGSLVRRRSASARMQPRWTWLRTILGVIVAFGAIATLVVLGHGPIDTAIGPVSLKMRTLNRALLTM